VENFGELMNTSMAPNVSLQVRAVRVLLKGVDLDQLEQRVNTPVLLLTGVPVCMDVSNHCDGTCH